MALPYPMASNGAQGNLGRLIASKESPAGQDRADGETKVKSSKWPGKLKFQIWIIVALVFIIWIILQNPERWG